MRIAAYITLILGLILFGASSPIGAFLIILSLFLFLDAILMAIIKMHKDIIGVNTPEKQEKIIDDKFKAEIQRQQDELNKLK